MRPVHWIVTLPLAVVAVVFAVSNRAPVSLTFWPLPLELETRLYLVVLLAALAGFFAGAFTAWVNAGHARRLARERKRRIEALERELATSQANFAKSDPPLAAAPPKALEAPSALRR